MDIISNNIVIFLKTQQVNFAVLNMMGIISDKYIRGYL